jgi:hypothetical protein
VDPPESTAGRLATAAGIIGAGAAAGGLAGRLLPGSATSAAKSILGAAVGALATAVGAFALSEFVGGDWAETERDAAIVGAGVVALVGVTSMAQAALPPASPPQLPPASPQNYNASEVNSGQTLNMRVGDTLTVILPGVQGSWQWAASANMGWMSETVSGNSVVDVFTAKAAGPGQVQGTTSGAIFTVTVNVLA